ncbi:hypothetical protein K438DRAFT_1782680 [Mycena galopus ATCC 62051]|nr:hypothetical protein K438DRAFT_1782680 [Mycena galopus ATCC 62051]
MEVFHKADWVSQGKKWQDLPPLVKRDVCEADLFNSSHASLTSPEVLVALRDLPNKIPALHQELTAARVMPGDTEVEELPFPLDDQMPYNDESDVPLKVLINHVKAGNSSKLPDRFAVDEAGNLARYGVAEDTELDIVANDLPLAVRHRKRSTKAPNPYVTKHLVKTLQYNERLQELARVQAVEGELLRETSGKQRDQQVDTRQAALKYAGDEEFLPFLFIPPYAQPLREEGGSLLARLLIVVDPYFGRRVRALPVARKTKRRTSSPSNFYNKFQNRAPEYYGEVVDKDDVHPDTEGVLLKIKKRVGSVLAREKGGVQTREGAHRAMLQVVKHGRRREPQLRQTCLVQHNQGEGCVKFESRLKSEADAGQEGEEDEEKEKENDGVGSNDD